MKSIILIASHILIPVSVIAPVASTLSSYKNNLSIDDAEAKSSYLSGDTGISVCDDLKDGEFKNWHSWCMKKREIASGDKARTESAKQKK